MTTSEAISTRLKQARLSRSITQAELARELDISQAAISQIERGITSAVSYAKIEQAAQILGIDLAGESERAVGDLVLKYCEHADCLSNVTYARGGRTIVRPRMTQAAAAGVSYCGECGELLMDHCPNDACGHPVAEGSFCTICGTPYVQPAPHLAGTSGGLAEHQVELERIRTMTRPRNTP